MEQLPETITLQAEDEAERLWAGAQQAFERAGSSLVSLCESLDLGIRAAEILAIQKLQPAKEKFPATLVLQLETPRAEVEAHRDAVTIPKAMQFTDILDLLSEEQLDCVGPKLHRGWEDRRFSCRRSRATAAEAIGLTVDAAEIVEAFPALAALVQGLTSA